MIGACSPASYFWLASCSIGGGAAQSEVSDSAAKNRRPCAIESFARHPTFNAGGTIHHHKPDATRVILWKLIECRQCLHALLPSLLLARAGISAGRSEPTVATLPRRNQSWWPMTAPVPKPTFCQAAARRLGLAAGRLIARPHCILRSAAPYTYVLCAIAARKSAAYRSLRSLKAAAQVPSAGTTESQS
jgi:hypothetical protein